MEKLIKKLIIIIVILIILIVLTILGINIINKYKEKNNPEIIDDSGNYAELETEEETIEISENEYYTVTNCISMYFDILNKNNSAFFGRGDNDDFIKVIEDSEIKEMVYQNLSENYITKNNITNENVYNFVDDIEGKVVFVPIDIKLSKTYNNTKKFIACGLLEDLNYNIKKIKYLIVNIDFMNKTFSIEPLEDNKYNSTDDITVEDDSIDEIKENDNNTFTNQMVTNEYVARNIMDTFKKITLGNPKYGYQLLDKEYREKRFTSEDEFVNYIKENREELSRITCSKYMINNYEEYEELICLDQYQNYYIFKINNINDYSIQLDTYTIKTDNFKTEYNSSDDEKRVKMNIDKWVQMLNRRDYKTAYQYLDETFRNNNFKTEEDFEKYMKERYKSHYEIQFTNSSEENGVFIEEVTLKSIEDNTNINKTIIIQLKEENEFVMSFDI